MKIIVGFFTARCREIDKDVKYSSYVVLWKKTFYASDSAIACFKAKRRVPLSKLTSELHRRHPNARTVGYTFEVCRRTAASNWLRWQASVKLEDLERIQRGEFTNGEKALIQRMG